jgi:hypothetical protein
VKAPANIAVVAAAGGSARHVALVALAALVALVALVRSDALAGTGAAAGASAGGLGALPLLSSRSLSPIQ